MDDKFSFISQNSFPESYSGADGWFSRLFKKPTPSTERNIGGGYCQTCVLWATGGGCLSWSQSYPCSSTSTAGGA